MNRTDSEVIADFWRDYKERFNKYWAESIAKLSEEQFRELQKHINNCVRLVETKEIKP